MHSHALRTLLQGGVGVDPDLAANTGFVTRSSTYNRISSGSGWSANKQYWNISDLIPGRMYTLRFWSLGNTGGQAGYFDFAACNSDDTVIDGSMDGKYSYDSTEHTFEFEAPAGAVRIRATRQASYTGVITPKFCNELVQSPLYATPPPSAHQLYSLGGNLVECLWKQNFAVSLDPASPTVTASGYISGTNIATTQNIGFALASISNASPCVLSKTGAHGLSAGEAIELTTTGALPTGLLPNTTYYVLAAGLTANDFEVSLTPGGAAINTSSAGSGAHRSAYTGKSYLVSSARAFDNNELISLVNHLGAAVHGVRSRYLHPTLGVSAIYNIIDIGKRNGTFAGLAAQFNFYGPTIIEGFDIDAGMDSHRNRFNLAAVVAVPVTLSIANPCVVTYAAHGCNVGQPFTLSGSGATIYYVLEVVNGSSFKFGIAQAPGSTQFDNSGTALAAAQNISIAASANAGPIALDGNPNNPTAVAVIANGICRNAGDSLLDHKHPNLWAVNITYDMSLGGFNVVRGLMVHSYAFNHTGTYVRSGPGGTGSGTLVTITSTAHGVSVGETVTLDFTGISDLTTTVVAVTSADVFTITHSGSGSDSGVVSFTKASEAAGKGLMRVVGFVCPDLHALDGFGYPLRMEDARCSMPISGTFINGEKIVSLAHARARSFIAVNDEVTFGPVTDALVPVYKLLPPDLPATAYWPVLKRRMKVRKYDVGNTLPFFDVTIDYPGPFPAGSLKVKFDPTAIAGAGISSGDRIDIYGGHYDGINHVWIDAALSDGALGNSGLGYDTMTLNGGYGAEKLTILSVGATDVGMTLSNNTAQNITAITKTNPAVVAYSGADTYANGDRVLISGVVGMTQVNGQLCTVANVNTTANTFELSGVDATGYGVYVSGGTALETAWWCPSSPAGTGYAHVSGSANVLKQTTPFDPVDGTNYLMTLNIGAISAQQMKWQFTGTTTVSGDNHGTVNGVSTPGIYMDEMIAANGNSSEQILPSSSALVASLILGSMKTVSYMLDATG